MSTTIDEASTNENEVPQEPRSIDALLALETYQGMTDEEIDLLLEYRIDQAVTSRETLARIAAISEKQEQCIADNLASAQSLRDMVQSMLEREFPTVPQLEPRRFQPSTIA